MLKKITITQRRNGATAQRRNGATAQRRNGATAQRRNGATLPLRSDVRVNRIYCSMRLSFLTIAVFFISLSYSPFINAQNTTASHSDSVYPGNVTTNISLFRQLDDWRDRLLDHQAKEVAAEIDDVMSGDIVPWRMNVFQTDEWHYQWGYLAWLTKAWALSWSGRKEDAYDALISATAYMPKTPPPRPYDYHYYRWYLTMGQIYSTFGRFYDAETYFTKIRTEMTTNDVLYYKATADLAHVYGYQGRYTEELSCLEEYFSFAEKPSAVTLHGYILNLFALGHFEQGCEALRNAVRIHGFSTKHNEHDYFLRDARRYWHCFERIDVLDWYMLLGEQIDTISLDKSSEKLFSLLINTRTLMKKVYPELNIEGDDDLARLRERLENEPPQLIVKNARTITTAPVKRNTGKKVKKREENQYYSDAKNKNAQYMECEKAINHGLYEAKRSAKYRRGYIKTWENILEKYDTNILSQITIDGMPGLYIVYEQLAINLGEKADDFIKATNYMHKALSVVRYPQNYVRYADAQLWIAEWLLKDEQFDAREASKYLNSALEDTDPYDAQIIKREILRAVIATTNTDQSDIDILMHLIDNYGCTLPQKVYQRAARSCYKNGRLHEAFDILEKGFRRSLLKLPYRDNYFLHLFYHARSLMTLEELERYQELVRTASLRIPAIYGQEAHAIGELLAKAEALWVKRQKRLAEIENTQNFSDEEWLFISNTVFNATSVRAGKLYIQAQAHRTESETNIIDWTGWLKAWKHTRADYGILRPNVTFPLEKMLLNVLEENVQKIDKELVSKLPELLNYMESIPEQSLLDSLRDSGETNIVAQYHIILLKRDPNLIAPSRHSYIYLEDYFTQAHDNSADILRYVCREEAEKNSEKSNLWLRLIQ